MEHPFIKEYLTPLMNLHRLLYIMMGKDDKYDTYSMIDSYMQTSEIRSKMDIGNWSALNKGWKQLYNDVDLSNCPPKTEEIDSIMLHWIADIYTLFQWMYNIPSKEINRRVPANVMSNIYYPLHEISIKRACEKIYEHYFENQ